MVQRVNPILSIEDLSKSTFKPTLIDVHPIIIRRINRERRKQLAGARIKPSYIISRVSLAGCLSINHSMRTPLRPNGITLTSQQDIRNDDKRVQFPVWTSRVASAFSLLTVNILTSPQARQISLYLCLALMMYARRRIAVSCWLWMWHVHVLHVCVYKNVTLNCKKREQIQKN